MDKKVVLCVNGSIYRQQIPYRTDLSIAKVPLLKDICIVKLGGSAITFKDLTPPKTNVSLLERVARELASYKGRLVIVLGGGAHGHQTAHRFGYGSPDASITDILSGIPHIRHNMSVLSQEVETQINKHGLNAVVHPPFCSVLLRNGKIKEYPLYHYRKSLESGLTVLTHGDVCFDMQKGASILSGDTIVTHLTRNLKPKSVLIGTDVDGVYKGDPKTNPDALFVPQLDSSNLHEVLRFAGPSGSTDVTGGMRRKLEELIDIAKYTEKIAIFNLTVPDRLQALLQHKKTRGTTVIE